MTPDRVLDRIRAANPAPSATITNDELFARIIASPGDPRLSASESRKRSSRRRWSRIGSRQLAFFAATLTLGAGGAVAAVKLGVINLDAFSHASPHALFKANPAGFFPGSPRQAAIPQTVHRATTATVPGVGRFEYWIALSKKGWLCEAIRLPDGTWADLPTEKIPFSGPAPGCGGVPWHDVEGFSYLQADVPSPDGQMWRMAYGYAPTRGNPVKVRDTISGATAPIGDGRYFAIVMPLCKRRACDVPHGSTSNLPGYQLETLNAAGRVVSKDQFDPGM